MKTLLQKHLKNQKGLTLIELLAVVVILGIIAAIAIPSIGAIIDNTRKDAHIANAEQMVNATKTAVATNVGDGKEYSLSQLVEAGLIENPDIPGKGGKYGTGTVKITTENNNKIYTVTLDKFIENKTITQLRGKGDGEGRKAVTIN
ncbi:prepilin-type N-terminal cleavage/methylation domain-containing protein [Alkalihalobacillus sp. NPDC078783]